MQTYSEMQAELLSRAMAASNSTLFTTTRIQNVLQDAYQKATSIYLWPQLESAKKTDTVASQYYYDYPSDFRTDSVSRAIIDDEEYERKDFEDYLNYKLANSTDTDTKIFADHNRMIFVFPTPTANGTDNFDVLGHIQASALATTTIFTYHDESGNEAVVKLGLSVLLAKINKNLAMQEENEAKAILATIYSKILQRKQRDQRLDRPFFEVPDFFD
jgi:hypothetical protein